MPADDRSLWTDDPEDGGWLRDAPRPGGHDEPTVVAPERDDQAARRSAAPRRERAAERPASSARAAAPPRPAPPRPAPSRPAPRASAAPRSSAPPRRPPADGGARAPRRGPSGRALVLAAVALLAVGVVVGLLLRSGPPTENVTVVDRGGGGGGSLKAAYVAARDGVVQVRTGSGNGTGWVYDDRGTIVTNAHVVSGERDVRVRFEDDGPLIRGRVLGRDPSSDLAVLRVSRDDAPRLVPLRLADSDRVETGDPVLAIGYPLGLDRTATAGIVSGVGRQISAPNGFSIDRVIQTDAPINPGNSGGPLLDVRGRVVGVNSQIATSGAGGGNVGIGFAVPSDTVRDVVPRLERGQSVDRAWIGISMGELPGVRGAVLADVTGGGPADQAGLRPAPTTSLAAGTADGGDVIVSIDGQRIERPDQVSGIVGSKRPGDTVRVEVERDGDRRTVEVRLGTRPASAPGSSGGGTP